MGRGWEWVLPQQQADAIYRVQRQLESMGIVRDVAVAAEGANPMYEAPNGQRSVAVDTETDATPVAHSAAEPSRRSDAVDTSTETGRSALDAEFRPAGVSEAPVDRSALPDNIEDLARRGSIYSDSQSPADLRWRYLAERAGFIVRIESGTAVGKAVGPRGFGVPAEMFANAEQFTCAAAEVDTYLRQWSDAHANSGSAGAAARVADVIRAVLAAEYAEISVHEDRESGTLKVSITDRRGTLSLEVGVHTDQVEARWQIAHPRPADCDMIAAQLTALAPAEMHDGIGAWMVTVSGWGAADSFDVKAIREPSAGDLRATAYVRFPDEPETAVELADFVDSGTETPDGAASAGPGGEPSDSAAEGTGTYERSTVGSAADGNPDSALAALADADADGVSGTRDSENVALPSGSATLPDTDSLSSDDSGRDGGELREQLRGR